MMIAVTDYDGTLCRNGQVEADTLSAIARWRAGGNMFGIATGRDFGMTVYELDRWGVPFDFLICCNGAALYGAQREALQYTNIDDALVPQLLQHPAGMRSIHYELCRGETTCLYKRSPESWFPALGVPYTEVSFEEALAFTGVQQICFGYEPDDGRSPGMLNGSIRLGASYAAMLNESFSGSLSAHHNKGCIDITKAGVSKAGGILDLLKLRQWPEERVLVIGDGENDLPMIRRFKGFAVAGASAPVLAEAAGVFESVGELLRSRQAS